MTTVLNPAQPSESDMQQTAAQTTGAEEAMSVKLAPIQRLIAAERSVRVEESDAEAQGMRQADEAHLALALQIQHNLQYQHSWTALTLHTHSPLTGALLPRPLLSGLPPQRLYVHPDEQIELLKEADRARKARKSKFPGGSGEGDAAEAAEGLEVKVEPEREWVLPTRLCEKWTLRRLSSVFEGIGVVPPEEKGNKNRWRREKRVVLASVDGDSTVVYYIVHDGVVKPRQN